MNAVEVRAVESAADWAEFHALRPALYRDDPAFVRPLAAEARLAIDPARHPFYEHAERQAFLARRNGRVVGRVAAIIDRLHNEHYGDRTGFFGFFECEDDREAARALVVAAADWLAARGRDRIRGPVNPSLKGEFGVVVLGNDDPPAIMMAHTPARYGPLIESLGLAKVHDFHAFVLTREGVISRNEHWKQLGALTERILARHPELRIVRATKHDLAATLKDVNQFGNRIRETVWGFTPITPAELDFLTHRIKRVMIPELVLTMRRGDELVGYVMAVPDVNQALRRTRGSGDLVRLVQMPFLMPKIRRARMFGIGADPKLRALGILPALFQTMIEGALYRFDEFEFGWISEANLQSLRAVQHVLPMEPRKTYRLYEAPLPLV
ncbi:MAG TPA: hypothetical protein VFK86_08645 [Bauldia sp.]|nr:hypothetical protein [Bauldia sp.]